jgi:predicted MPP superfamily phosphohydrolase
MVFLSGPFLLVKEVQAPLKLSAATRRWKSRSLGGLDAMAADGHQLIIAGHTHGGQLRLPFYGALVTNCDLDRGRARGLTRHPDWRVPGASWLHVSAGLGTSPYAPVRLCCRPEASLLTLTAAEA